MLKWANENECPWNEAVPKAAAEGGHLEVLKWALANGCPWDKTQCANAAMSSSKTEVLDWIMSR